MFSLGAIFIMLEGFIIALVNVLVVEGVQYISTKLTKWQTSEISW